MNNDRAFDLAATLPAAVIYATASAHTPTLAMDDETLVLALDTDNISVETRAMMSAACGTSIRGGNRVCGILTLHATRHAAYVAAFLARKAEVLANKRKGIEDKNEHKAPACFSAYTQIRRETESLPFTISQVTVTAKNAKLWPEHAIGDIFWRAVENTRAASDGEAGEAESEASATDAKVSELTDAQGMKQIRQLLQLAGVGNRDTVAAVAALLKGAKPAPVAKRTTTAGVRPAHVARKSA
jgi:hypothetical protein